jgi:hypothetical protein
MIASRISLRWRSRAFRVHQRRELGVKIGISLVRRITTSRSVRRSYRQRGPSFTSMQRTSVRQRRRDQKATSLVSTFEVSDGCLFIGQGATHGQSNRDLSTMDNRFSTMTEVRRVAWPAYETTEWDEMQFMQGIAGTLELFHRSTIEFQRVVGEVTGQPVAVFQRIDQAGYKLPIDDRVLDDTDTRATPLDGLRSSSKSDYHRREIPVGLPMDSSLSNK